MKPFKSFQGFIGRGSDPPRGPAPCISHTAGLHELHGLEMRGHQLSKRASARVLGHFIPWPPGADKPRTDSACLPVVTCGRCGDDATSSRSSDDVRWGKVRVTSEGSHRGDGGGAAAVMGWMIMGWMGWMID